MTSLLRGAPASSSALARAHPEYHGLATQDDGRTITGRRRPLFYAHASRSWPPSSYTASRARRRPRRQVRRAHRRATATRACARDIMPARRACPRAAALPLPSNKVLLQCSSFKHYRARVIVACCRHCLQAISRLRERAAIYSREVIAHTSS